MDITGPAARAVPGSSTVTIASAKTRNMILCFMLSSPFLSLSDSIRRICFFIL